MVDEKHIRELVERHTYKHKAVRYRVALWRLRLDPPTQGGIEPRAVDLDFTPAPISGGEAVRLSLHLGMESALDDVFLLDATDGTISKIAYGGLPPGTRELL
jgi:hypothetical protein